MCVVEDLQCDLFGPGGGVVQLRRGGPGHLAQDLGPRVVRAVGPVAEAAEALVARVSVVEPLLGVFGGADLVEHVARRECGAAVGRSFKRGDRADDARGKVAAGRGDDARGEGGGVEAVVREQHEVRVDEMCLLRVRLLAFETPEQVGGVAEVLARLDRLLPLPTPVRHADDCREDGGQRDRFLQARFGQRRAGSLRGDDGAQDVHRVGGRVHRRQRFARGILELSCSGHLLTQGVKLLFVGQLAMPEEISDLLVGRDRHEVLDEVSAAIDETAVRAVDFADGGLSGHHTFQPGAELRHFETNSRWSQFFKG